MICVGNLVAGGAGKTPAVIAIGKLLAKSGTSVHFLTRGYGGSDGRSRRVDPAVDRFEAVGDEALLLARHGLTWSGADRVASAEKAIGAGADVLIMDDGFQNPALNKDLSLLVIDGQTGFGNGRILPAGPLRESAAAGFARADAVLYLGDVTAAVRSQVATYNLRHLPAFEGRLSPDAAGQRFAGRRVVAFAGIGRPEKFFATLRELGAELVETCSFGDHHPYLSAEIDKLKDLARQRDAVPVTTEKDAMRLSSDDADGIEVLRVTLEWMDADAVRDWVRPLIG